METNIVDFLRSRGFIDNLTSEELVKHVDHPIKAYIGFDPTSDSLHLGNLVGIVLLGWFQRFGHVPVVILGGATGKIGDPSGKSLERPLLDQATLSKNVAGIRKNFECVLDFSHQTAAPLMLNNDDWLGKLPMIDFLRDVGKHFRVGTMLGKDSVRSRIDSDEGMSYTEFSYMLLQAYDFYHLLSEEGVSLQMGGSDQWGNITAGIELIRKISGTASFGLTFPLITRSDGKKFGKSEQGAIWLSSEKLSPYQFYQYLVRMPDPDVIKLMRLLTFMEMEEIAAYEKSMSEPTYVPNTVQKRLASEITRMIHGEEGLQAALKVTEAASPGAKAMLDPETLATIAADMPHCSLSSEEVVNQKFVDVAVKIGLLSSKGEATRLIQNGGAYLNENKVEDVQLKLESTHLIGGKFLLFAAGKKKKILVEIGCK
jgi:tyrosyl-tRNA synthetase